MKITHIFMLMFSVLLKSTAIAEQHENTPLFSEPRFNNTGNLIVLRHCNTFPCGILVIDRSGKIISEIENTSDFDWLLPMISNYKKGFVVSVFDRENQSTNIAWIDENGNNTELLTQQNNLHYLLSDQSKDGQYLLYTKAHPKESGIANAIDFQICELNFQIDQIEENCVPNFSIDLADRPSYINDDQFLLSGFEVVFEYRSGSDEPEVVESEPIYYLDLDGNIEQINMGLRFPSDPTAVDNGQIYISGLSITREDSSFGYDIFLWKDESKKRVTYLETLIRSFDVSADGQWLIIDAWDKQQSKSLLYLVNTESSKVDSIIVEKER